MVGRIPPTVSEVEAANECDGVIDDHNLLVMRAANGMFIVEAEAQARRRMRFPTEFIKRKPFAIPCFGFPDAWMSRCMALR